MSDSKSGVMETYSLNNVAASLVARRIKRTCPDATTQVKRQGNSWQVEYDIPADPDHNHPGERGTIHDYHEWLELRQRQMIM